MSKINMFKKFFHDVLGWHSPDYTIGVWGDGCNFYAKCKHCGENIMIDSQGNWFTYDGGAENEEDPDAV